MGAWTAKHRGRDDRPRAFGRAVAGYAGLCLLGALLAIRPDPAAPALATPAVDPLVAERAGPVGAGDVISWLVTGGRPGGPLGLLRTVLPGIAGLPPARPPAVPVTAPAAGRVTPKTTPAAGRAVPNLLRRPAVLPAATPAVEGPLVVFGLHPLVLIYHTHGQESFLPATGKLLSPDPQQDVVRLGAALAGDLFSEYGIPAAHLRTAFDAPGTVGAYVRSLAGVQKVLARHPSLHLLLDLHRDQAPAPQTTAVIGGQGVARVMIVVGDDQTLPEPNWRRNAAWAVEMASAFRRAYPGLLRTYQGHPYYSDGGRFNQQLSPAALLLEIGGTHNTMAEELRGVQLVARVLAGMIRAGRYPH